MAREGTRNKVKETNSDEEEIVEVKEEDNVVEDTGEDSGPRQCPECRYPFKDPVVGSCGCGAIFCRGCARLGECREVCPSCCQLVNEWRAVPETDPLVLWLRDHVVDCSNSADSCQWRGLSTQALALHVAEQCEHTLLSCTEDCGAQMKRLLLQHHLQNECPKKVRNIPNTFLLEQFRRRVKDEQCQPDLVKLVQLVGRRDGPIDPECWELVCEHGLLDVLRALLQAKIVPDPELLWKGLVAAAKSGQIAVLGVLRDYCSKQVLSARPYGDSPLQVAVENGQLDVAILLLDFGLEWRPAGFNQRMFEIDFDVDDNDHEEVVVLARHTLSQLMERICQLPDGKLPGWALAAAVAVDNVAAARTLLGRGVPVRRLKGDEEDEDDWDVGLPRSEEMCDVLLEIGGASPADIYPNAFVYYSLEELDFFRGRDSDPQNRGCGIPFYLLSKWMEKGAIDDLPSVFGACNVCIRIRNRKRKGRAQWCDISFEKDALFRLLELCFSKNGLFVVCDGDSVSEVPVNLFRKWTEQERVDVLVSIVDDYVQCVCKMKDTSIKKDAFRRLLELSFSQSGLFASRGFVVDNQFLEYCVDSLTRHGGYVLRPRGSEVFPLVGLIFCAALQGGKVEAVEQLVSWFPKMASELFEDASLPLHVACQAGKHTLALCTYLVEERGAVPDHKALCHAVRSESATIVQYLLEQNAPIISESEKERNVLDQSLGNDEITLILLDAHRKQHVKIPDGFLVFAAYKGRLSVVRSLVEHPDFGPGQVVDVNRFFRGVSALTMALEAGHDEIVLYLLDHDADPDMDVDGENMLRKAVWRNKVAVVNKLLSLSLARRNQVNKLNTGYDENLLHIAAQDGNEEMVQVLLQYQADPSVTNKQGQTPLCLAVKRGYLAVAKCLSSCEDPSGQVWTDAHGNTLLHLVAEELCSGDHSELLHWLVFDQNVPLSQKNAAEDTAIHVAVTRQNDMFLRELTKLVADGQRLDGLEEPDEDGYTALHHTAFNGWTLGTALLLAAGANVDCARSKATFSHPLHCAAVYGHLPVVRLLVGRGAVVDAECANSSGRTALRLALYNGHDHVVQYLVKECGARVPLLEAARNGWTGVLKAIWASKDLTTFLDYNGDDEALPLLRAAVKENRVETVKWMLSPASSVLPVLSWTWHDITVALPTVSSAALTQKGPGDMLVFMRQYQECDVVWRRLVESTYPIFNRLAKFDVEFKKLEEEQVNSSGLLTQFEAAASKYNDACRHVATIVINFHNGAASSSTSADATMDQLKRPVTTRNQSAGAFAVIAGQWQAAKVGGLLDMLNHWRRTLQSMTGNQKGQGQASDRDGPPGTSWKSLRQEAQQLELAAKSLMKQGVRQLTLVLDTVQKDAMNDDRVNSSHVKGSVSSAGKSLHSATVEYGKAGKKWGETFARANEFLLTKVTQSIAAVDRLLDAVNEAVGRGNFLVRRAHNVQAALAESGEAIQEQLQRLEDEAKQAARAELDARHAMERGRLDLEQHTLLSSSNQQLQQLITKHHDCQRARQVAKRRLERIKLSFTGVAQVSRPELFLECPSLRQIAGTLLDSSFEDEDDAQTFKVNNRTLDCYSGVEPLTQSPTAGTGARVSRAIAPDGTTVVLKRFAYGHGDGGDDRARKQLLKEMRALRRLGRHPNVVAIRALFFDQSTAAYLEMPYYSQGDLWAWLTSQDHPAPWRVQLVLRGALTGLCHVHRCGVVHGDVKPQNIFVDEHGNGVLGDFDVARDARGHSLLVTADAAIATTATSIAGTLNYMAPELIRGRGKTKPSTASDVYAMGLTIYDCYFRGDQQARPSAEKVAWENAQVMASNNDTEDQEEEEDRRQLRQLLSSALAMDPKARPSAGELLAHPFFQVPLSQVGPSRRRLVDPSQADPLQPRRCVIDSLCDTQEALGAGLECTAAEARHFVCAADLNDYVSHWIDSVSEHAALQSGLQVQCPAHQCPHPLPAASLSLILDVDVFNGYLERCQQLKATVAVREAEAVMQMEIEKLRDRLRRQNGNHADEDQVAALVTEHRRHIEEQLLTLRCPHCHTAVLDWDGCMAITHVSAVRGGQAMQCGQEFCGFCFEKCEPDLAHSHVVRCPRNPQPGQLYCEGERIVQAHHRLKRERLQQYLQSIADATLRRLVSEATERVAPELFPL